jgi:hypothetical protein
MLSSPDPFTQMIRNMCTKDKIVQSLYQHTITWADVPSDDDVLEMDDWKSYQKMEMHAKEAYKNHLTTHKKVYTIPQRTKVKKHCNQVASRIPYANLKQRTAPESTIQKEIVEEIVHQPPVEYQEMESIRLNKIVEEPPQEMESICPNEIVEVHPEPIKTISTLYVLYCIIFLSLIIFYRMIYK